ncbi:MFS transporter [Methylobacterium sp. J-077]|uniref:MFS transporter n=2 Tax=unclassified Methylobacterium TaxID=2615210 RepID=UPI001FBAF9B1|nr:MFS transporter [Methylobacterium sp. J-077]MCJ2126979.1 MFS transporter [Methylobacterium sp. J-077]
MSNPSTTADPIGREALRRISLRLLPFLALSYLANYIDRVNAGFAALQMNREVGLTASAFGFGGGMFFIAYLLFEVPSNLAMVRVGARLWLARIMITWGLVSGAMALTSGPVSFCVLRFLLGAAEAGFVPGVILYLMQWFPARERARVIGLFMVASPVAGIVGSPISAALLGFDGWLGLSGWQWLFIVEAMPAVVIGLVGLVWLTDTPAQAGWLEPEHKDWLAGRLAVDAAARTSIEKTSVWAVMGDRTVLVLSLIYAGQATANAGLSLWQPQFLKSFGLSTTEVGLVNAIPFAVAALAMYAGGRSSDQRDERVWHTAVPTALTTLGLCLCLVLHGLAPTVLLLCLALFGVSASRGPFWALATEWLSTRAAVAGIAQINAVGTGASFFTSWATGAIKDATGSWPLALLPLAGVTATATAAVILLGRPRPSVEASSDRSEPRRNPTTPRAVEP